MEFYNFTVNGAAHNWFKSCLKKHCFLQEIYIQVMKHEIDWFNSAEKVTGNCFEIVDELYSNCSFMAEILELYIMYWKENLDLKSADSIQERVIMELVRYISRGNPGENRFAPPKMIWTNCASGRS